MRMDAGRFGIRQIRDRKQRGTTLVELLVALGIFSIFISLAIGGFIQSLASQRVLLKLMAATDNMSFALEQMTREIRVGSQFIVGPQGDTIEFIRPADISEGESGNTRVRYVWNQGAERLERELTSVESGTVLAPQQAVTADNVAVSYFHVEAQQQKIPGPWRVTMTSGITAQDKRMQITNYIQASINSRGFSD